MDPSEALPCFDESDLIVVNDAVSLAEELTSDAYRMSFAHWVRNRYDVKTMADLRPEEIVHGPFAQIIRYVGRKPDTMLGTSQYDFYKICLQDHTILSTRNRFEQLRLFPFVVYIVCHELIHVVRFTTFQQAFEASSEEKIQEEARVHQQTQMILARASIKDMTPVFEFYQAWQEPIDALQEC
jgi:hypothetical protein